MRTKFIYFIIFQLIAWTLYFNWEGSSIQESATAEKLIKIAEISPKNVNNSLSDKNNYKLILRNDGFFTRVNADQTKENGLWKINYEEASLILTSSKGEFHYRILDQINDGMQVRLIQTNELARKEDQPDQNRLFSSSSLN